MIFTEVRCLLLLVGCWLSFFAAPRRFRVVVLTAWGVAFYGLYAGPLVWLVIELVIATYLVSRGRADVLLGAIVVFLFVDFKTGLNLIGLPASPASSADASALLIPLGFSFLAFELLHVLIELRRGRIVKPLLADLGAFAFFFPCRIAGPIKRYPDFIKAVEQAEVSADNVYAGVVRVAIGIFKKVVIADLLALTAAEASYAATFVHAWTVMLAFSIEIYLDFSAYSDIAIGMSRTLGIAVPENFNWPYLSPNIQEFWTRWHMTLSAWVRDYVFQPSGRALFKTRLKSSPAAIAALSYIGSFLVIGAWHGVSPNFLAWGAYHGTLVTAYYVYRTRLPEGIIKSPLFQSRFAAVAGTGLTFLLVTIGWVPFTNDLQRSMQLLKLMLGGH